MHGFDQNNFVFESVALVDGPTVSIDTFAGVVHSLSTTQDVTVNFTNTGQMTTLLVTCDPTPRTITWGTLAHANASTYVLTASKKHVFTFIYHEAATEHVLASVQVLS